jgi:hypothetical protein
MVAIILALVGGFWISSVCAYDQFEGYDLSDPYPTVSDWYRVDDQRREDRRDFEERQRYDEWDNHNPYTRRFQLEIEDMRYE